MLATAAPTTRFARVFSPAQVGHLTLVNRIALSATTTNLAVRSRVTDELIAFYRERALGGVGLVVTEAIAVHPTSGARSVALTGFEDDAIEGLARLAKCLRDEGVPAIAQLHHAGRNADPVEGRGAAWAPSALRASHTAEAAHVMSEDDIAEIVGAFASAAGRMIQAGFDGVEIHMGHGHLLQQFLSPFSNRRDDEYGGDEARRSRFPVEVVQAVNESVGGRGLIAVRMTGDEGRADGLTADACHRAALVVAAAGPLAYMSVTQGGPPSHRGGDLADMHQPKAGLSSVVAGMKAALGSLPVVAVCRYTTIEEAESALASGRGDVVAMSRALIADPHLVRKTRVGKAAEVRPCIACNRCYAQISAGAALRCTVNARAGRELERPSGWGRAAVADPSLGKRIVVVGGGVAGMEAAREAALRGHRVLLWERAHELGGQLRLARQGVGRQELDLFRVWLEAELTRLGVRVQLDTHVDAARLIALAPDVVVVAVGSRPTMANLPGFGAMTPASKLLDMEPVAGEHIAITDLEGGWVTASAIETAAARGGRVTVVTPAETLLWALPAAVRAALLDRLSRRSVSVFVMRKPVQYEARTLIVEDVVSARIEHIPGVGRVYVSQPRQADDQLVSDLRRAGAAFPVLVVGDAHAPRQLLEAVRDGFEAAWSL